MEVENALKEGIQLYNRGNYSSALSFFLSLPEDCGSDPVEVAYYLGLSYARLKRYDDALVYLEQVVTSRSRDESAKRTERVLQCRYALAVIYCMSGRRKLADFELKKLLETGYNTAEVYSSLAYVAWENGEVDESIDYYNKALSSDENCPTALNGLGYVLASRERDLTRALGLCKRAVDLQGQNAACLDSLGYVYLKMGLFAEARKYFLQAGAADPDNRIIALHLKEAEEGQE